MSFDPKDRIEDPDDPDSNRFHLDDLSIAPTTPKPKPTPPNYPGKGSATALRNDLNDRAFRYALRHQLPFDTTPTPQPSVVFGPRETPEGPTHGNFLPQTYRALHADPNWSQRLNKAHTAHRRVWPRAEWRWRELDAAASSDALLMNIFCYPSVLADRPIRALLGIPANLHPEFGHKPRIPLANRKFDRTEIDLRLGSLLIEAKLTETATLQTPRRLIERYPTFPEAFEPTQDPTAFILNYQFHRGVLAALAEPQATFCLLADARRPDLLEAWFAVLTTVRTADLRSRLQMLTWQELAATLPAELQQFLDEKYGITSV